MSTEQQQQGEIIFIEPVVKPAVLPEEQVYRVPTRFGMSGILAITTLMAVLFGVLRNFPGFMNLAINEQVATHPVVYLFFSVLMLSTCFVQMFYGSVPREASGAVGAIWLWLFVLGFAIYSRDVTTILGSLFATPLSLAVGAFLGYIAGTLTAGCFLMMDYAEALFFSRKMKMHPQAADSSTQSHV